MHNYTHPPLKNTNTHRHTHSNMNIAEGEIIREDEETGKLKKRGRR